MTTEVIRPSLHISVVPSRSLILIIASGVPRACHLNFANIGFILPLIPDSQVSFTSFLPKLRYLLRNRHQTPQAPCSTPKNFTSASPSLHGRSLPFTFSGFTESPTIISAEMTHRNDLGRLAASVLPVLS